MIHRPLENCRRGTSSRRFFTTVPGATLNRLMWLSAESSIDFTLSWSHDKVGLTLGGFRPGDLM
jgi:hypothetical protein